MSETKKRWWMRRYFGWCEPCGRDQSYSERVYGPKPEHKHERVVMLDGPATYCGCLDREMAR